MLPIIAQPWREGPEAMYNHAASAYRRTSAGQVVSRLTSREYE
jgi:hypothetical protein